MSVLKELNNAKDTLKNEISSREICGYTTHEWHAKNAYQHALNLVNAIADAYAVEYQAVKEKNNAKQLKITYPLDVLGRDFVIEIDECQEKVALQIIEDAYFKWFEEDSEYSCEEYIEKALKHYHLDFKSIKKKKKRKTVRKHKS